MEPRTGRCVFPKDKDTVRVIFTCTGVGIFNRGIESFFREVFDARKLMPGIDAWLLKGGGEPRENEIPVLCLPRTGMLARFLGGVIQRSGYVAEQISSFPFVVEQVRRLRPHVIFYSDANLGFQLFRWRNQIGVPFRLLFSNGGPCRPPFNRTDFVQQVAPYYHDHAMLAGEQPGRHFLVPYGINVGKPPSAGFAARRALRQRLSLPVERPLILSVGWISREHKRMHYLIEELSRLPAPRPFLQMLGAMDESSREIVDLAEQLLGPDGFSARSVPYEGVFDFYRAADIFALASLQEGLAGSTWKLSCTACR